MHLPLSNSVADNRTWTSLLDIHHPDSWHTPVAVTILYSTPDDGRRKRPKHVLAVVNKNRYCPKLHLVGSLYNIDLW